MSKVGSWSTTPGSNNSTPPDGWPEGQAASTVNDCAREMMAQIRTMVADAQYIDLNNTPSFLTTTTFSLGTTDVANWEVGRRVKLYDNTTLYGTIISVSATFVQVRLDSGVLTTSLSSAALSVLHNTSHALPDAAYAQQNVIINGAMDIWQRTAAVANVANLQYVADRFQYIGVNSAAINMQRLERSAAAGNVPTLASAGVQLTNSMLVYVSAVDATIAAGDFAGIRYNIEGYDFRQIAHRPLGLSFQVNTNKSGVYAVSLRNAGSSASYIQNFTISAVSVWQRFFVPFPEAPTTPYTWDYSSGVGLQVTFALACGSTFQAAAGAWTAMNAIATSSQVNFLANAGNTFSITDIRLKAGNADTPFSTRPYAEELELAQRYFETGQDTIYFTASGGEEFRNSVPFATTKRGTPTITLAAGTQVNIAASSSVNPGVSKFDHRVTSTGAGLTTDDGAVWQADAEL